MRANASSKKNSPAAVARVPWRVVDVRVIDSRRLHVRFADDTEGEVDLAPDAMYQDIKATGRRIVGRAEPSW